ncbi:MAG: outer membrane lipid asymmetry maintenance protein MlaD [Holosporales bacterium]|nr:outer membrane lipid asymmetry maintenance protein MlaD [Holosporales bacterium]
MQRYLMQNSMVETVVGGIVVLIATAFLIFGYLTSSSVPSGGGNTYKAVFDSVDGLSVNSEIKIGGVSVGCVSAIEFDEAYRVKLTLKVRKGIRIPDDSSVAITSSGLMGDKFVEIILGVSDDFLEDGATFVYARPPLNFESLINKLIAAFVSKKSDSA